MVLSTLVEKSIYHREKSQKLAFRAIALRQSEAKEWGRVSKEKNKTPLLLYSLRGSPLFVFLGEGWWWVRGFAFPFYSGQDLRV